LVVWETSEGQTVAHVFLSIVSFFLSFFLCLLFFSFLSSFPWFMKTKAVLLQFFLSDFCRLFVRSSSGFFVLSFLICICLCLPVYLSHCLFRNILFLLFPSSSVKHRDRSRSMFFVFCLILLCFIFVESVAVLAFVCVMCGSASQILFFVYSQALTVLCPFVNREANAGMRS